MAFPVPGYVEISDAEPDDRGMKECKDENANDDSPKSCKRPREGTGALAKHGEPFPEESAEAMLERLLRDKGVGSDSPAPAWAMQMQSMFMSQHSMLSTQISDFHEIVTKQDCRIDDLQHVVEKNKKDDDARFQALSSQVQTLTEEVRRHRSPPQTSAVTPSGPTSSWRGEGKHNGNQTDTNFLHVIVGGWNFDSDRDVITRDLDAFLRHWSDSHKSLIVRTFVWGRKSRIANIILQSTSSPEEDRARFYDIQAAYSNKASNSQGNTVWLTPSKTPERRAKNRAISACREALAKLLQKGTDALVVDFGKGIIWFEFDRLAALELTQIQVVKPARVFSVKVSSEPSFTCHFNVGPISGLTGISEAEVEAQLGQT